MSAKVLIVEDEAPLAEMLRYNLEAEGFRVAHAETGEEALILLEEERPDLVVLDWMLPGVSGIELCRRLRAKSRLAQRADPHADGARRGERPHPRAVDRRRRLRRQAVLAAGADGARQGHPAAHLARSRGRSAEDRRHRARPRRPSRHARAAPGAARARPSSGCSSSSWKAPGRVLSRTQLLDGVWGRDAFVDERTVDVHIGRLRKALIRGNERDPIRTVRSAGYVFGEA